MSATANAFGSISADAYRQPGTVTGSNPDNFSATAKPAYLGGTGVNRNKLVEVYNPTSADGTQLVTAAADLTHTDPAPVAPNFPEFGRDPYKQGGMPSETYLDNVAGPASAAPASDGGPATL